MFKDGWYQKAKHIKSCNHNSRPTESGIDLVVIHCISLPEGDYENDNVEQFFQNRLDISIDDSLESLENVRVSAHFYIKRNGEVVQFVSVDDRAWHAGVSEYHSRQGCNDFSVGIEMQGTDKDFYQSEQYRSLNILLLDMKKNYPSIKNITGHEDIAPGRKTDPGVGFNWDRVNF
ncbi:1,6-anhydro-N-acetylmuramyl-L-alanine amidase AmpD [Francisella adeliensis]|uniref:1,6-anhydro-N-acetylmuramyl-L-alanine amidase AmpD n=1 Tax=Francisella adeliensis TaxID=2007306 RepID=A0A2Z4XX52_9GAMM|nr:1,6-anhydro-N-acetylmuramyl-L-alanine amidase AmpD [Francisella adeliensis]AXA33296.1 N-acetylmuramoyl-L-alanine amidase [Francisella adeliensis]MBK2084975.1 1,6-anhydro-N-acetylmuramyl-L-alanine amidase AmpD [Francisella adeliensis]MBK2097033.1 1,6-anhydro-N-acetylmuramyl-L-alanine amidase AmpD [Francisella adeliensis]QIW11525.1 1,6-anhydro-N-acetylmuramyl-L-alanine amidase AmpD [Francisella adeliensis]QIW13400.1 1,6-anhydro-N-acetylmuramyl-L-alanine amidase AmpD [Francisella adeliensis]